MPQNSPVAIARLSSADADFPAQLAALLRPPAAAAEVRAQVAAMVARIEQEGDAALLEFSARFDDFRPDSVAAFEVPPERLRDAAQHIPPALRDDLHTAAERLRDYHRRQLPQNWHYEDALGNKMGEVISPVQRALVYVPGGTAAYPSSVLMGVLPAKIAGVEEVVLTTPAARGVVPPVTLAAAAIAGCDRVFMLGGAQAVIGFSVGGNSLPKADVVVGPGNAYVAEAKRQLFGRVGVESVAGPSEVLILSDGSAPPAWVAADMAAQAEHDTLAQSILLSTDAAHMDAVVDALADLLPTLARAETIRESLHQRGACIHAPDIATCCRIADEIASEHLQVMTADAEAVAARVKNAGGVFIGAAGCVPFGDYLAGTNHILPTGGTARFSSPLGVHNFIKRRGVFHASPAGAAALAPAVSRLASAEGLEAHAHAAALRRKDGGA